MKRIITLAGLALLGGCGESRPEATESVEVEMVEPVPTPPDLSKADQGRACRAVIASLNGRDPAIMRVIEHDRNFVTVRYARDDGTVWTNQCRVSDGSAEWRMIEGGRPGRWRDEDTVNFQIDGQKIAVQTFMNGEPVTSDTYMVE